MKIWKIFLAMLAVGLVSCQTITQSGVKSKNSKVLEKNTKVSSGSSVATYATFITEIMNIGGAITTDKRHYLSQVITTTTSTFITSSCMHHISIQIIMHIYDPD